MKHWSRPPARLSETSYLENYADRKGKSKNKGGRTQVQQPGLQEG
jgi:hypothetical protein